MKGCTGDFDPGTLENPIIAGKWMLLPQKYRHLMQPTLQHPVCCPRRSVRGGLSEVVSNTPSLTPLLSGVYAGVIHMFLIHSIPFPHTYRMILLSYMMFPFIYHYIKLCPNERCLIADLNHCLVHPYKPFLFRSWALLAAASAASLTLGEAQVVHVSHPFLIWVRQFGINP